MSHDVMTGQCQCGELRYRLSGSPLSCYACHCRGCQRGSGSPYTVSLLVGRSDLEVLAGTLGERRFRMPSGERSWQGCESCASSLWYASPLAPQIVAIKPGTLDDPERYQPVAHLWTQHTQSHVRFAEGATCFEEQPSLDVLVELWQARSARVEGDLS